MVPLVGIEPSSTPSPTRTEDFRIRNPIFYPTELKGRMHNEPFNYGAKGEARWFITQKTKATLESQKLYLI